MNEAIIFENVGKQYRLGLVGTGTLQHDLNRWFQTSILRKEDPYLKIGEVNDRSTKGHSDYVWALKDISFKVEQGDVVGIIGKNGAGKSTLLKLLSHITAPTTGHITYKGRIASLLEVGTGFHPEMTARENIYMNGSIMGMTRQEITRKLDEIVDFAGIERYLDTPVKRFSSGMTVRLGFAVAAFLEPEILVVDEVLAVGDAEFQKKAIGKMQDVSSSGGRTVLFVSHNMGSIRALCRNGILLENGTIKKTGAISDIIETYLEDNRIEIGNISELHNFKRLFNRTTKKIEILNVERKSSYLIDSTEPIVYILKIRKKHIDIEPFSVSTFVADSYEQSRVLMSCSDTIKWNSTSETMEMEISITNHHLTKGIYYIDIWINSGDIQTSFIFHDAIYQTITFEIDSFEGKSFNSWNKTWGKSYQKSQVSILNK